MADPLIRSDHLVGSWDADTGGWDVRDFTAGPAGSVAAFLPGAVELDVDAAAPATLTGLWIPAEQGGRPSDETVQVMRALLGDERVAEVLSMRDPTPHILRSAGPWFSDEPRLRSLNRLAGQGGRGVDGALGQLALATVLDDPTLTDMARGLALLEAARAGQRVADALGRNPATSEAQRGAELLLSGVQQGHLDDLPISGRELVSLLLALTKDLQPSTQQAIARVVARIERGHFGLDGVSAAAAASRGTGTPTWIADDAHADDLEMPMRVASSLPLGDLLDVVDRRTIPDALAGRAIAVRATTDSELEVRLSGRTPEDQRCWARGFAPDGTVVAAAPFRRVGSDAVARLLVPPAVLRLVDVDITGSPGEPRPSRRVRAVADAIGAGREAARAERLGDWPAASLRWQESAARWEQAGDPARAGLAGEYSTGGGRQLSAPDDRIPPALLVDRVIEAEEGR